jgi:hypothetical protein
MQAVTERSQVPRCPGETVEKEHTRVPSGQVARARRMENTDLGWDPAEPHIPRSFLFTIWSRRPIWMAVPLILS